MKSLFFVLAIVFGMAAGLAYMGPSPDLEVVKVEYPYIR